MATWKYEDHIIAEKDRNIPTKLFKGRLGLNRTDYTLTLRRLTVQDSGHFVFTSAGENENQMPTYTFVLQVYGKTPDFNQRVVL